MKVEESKSEELQTRLAPGGRRPCMNTVQSRKHGRGDPCFRRARATRPQLLQNKFETLTADPTLRCQRQIWEDSVLSLLNSTFDEPCLARQELDRI